MPLISCKAVQSHSLGIVRRNTFAGLKHDAQVVLSACMPLIRGKTVQSRSLGIVLRNAAITKIVAHSNHKLPKAAARRSALPSKHKPSRLILGNTVAIQVAAAECSLLCAQPSAAPAEANSNARSSSTATPALPSVSISDMCA